MAEPLPQILPRTKAAPRVAILFPARHLLDGAGAAAVLRLQIAALSAAGAVPFLVPVAPSLVRRRVPAATVEALVGEAAALGIELAAIAGPASGWPALPALARTAWRAATGRPFGPEEDVDLTRLAGPPEAVAGAERGRSGLPSADAVLCNYVSCLSAADRLAPPERQLVILHDLAEAGPSQRFLDVLAGRPNLMCISADETRALGGRLPGAGVQFGLPFEFSSRSFPAIRPDAAPSAAALFAAAGASGGGETEWAEARWRRGGIDLLFVGGRHPPNVEGLRRFIEDCFRPLLSSGEATLAVAGSVCDALADLRTTPGVALLGRVRDLEPLYAAARLVVVPLISGSGVSIKTLEALGRGRAVLSTPAGFRGIGLGSPPSLPPPFDARWATAIRELTQGPDAAGRRADRLAGTLRQLAGPGIGEALRRLLPALLAGTPLPVFPPGPLLPDGRSPAFPETAAETAR